MADAILIPGPGELDPSALTSAAVDVYAYYRDITRDVADSGGVTCRSVRVAVGSFR